MLTVEQVCEWVDIYRAAHEGEFPTVKSGAIKDREGKDTGENWAAVNSLFWNAAKGFPARGLQHCGFGSLAKFLDKTYSNEREPRIEKTALSLSQIKEWVDAYREGHRGRFPTTKSGAIKDREGKDTGENWAAVDALFNIAANGFPARGLRNSGFGSLAEFLDKTYPHERRQHSAPKPASPRGDNINPLLDLLE
jgi:hypothetical protein